MKTQEGLTKKRMLEIIKKRRSECNEWYNRLFSRSLDDIESFLGEKITRQKRYVNAVTDKEKLVILKSYYKKHYMDKELDRVKDDLDWVFNGKRRIVRMRIDTEWKESRSYGLNAYTKAYVTYENGETEMFESESWTSGCGYDKYSTSIASALNNSAAVRNMLCTEKVKGCAIGCDGSLYGGVGEKCYFNAFSRLGFDVDHKCSKLWDSVDAIRK